MQRKRAAATGHLRRDIGMLGVALLTLNGLLGASIYALPAVLYERAGMLSPWLFLLAGLLFVSVVLSFGELASYFSASGGPVLYMNEAFGPLAGMQTGWLLYLSRMTAMAANANVLIYYGALLLPWIVSGWGRGLFLLALFALMAGANVRGVKHAINSLGALSVLKLAPVLLLILIGIPWLASADLVPVSLSFSGDKGATVLLLMYAFMGFEGALVTAGETDRPQRNVPRALLLGMAAIALLYFLVQLVYSAVAPQVPPDGAALVELGRALIGPAGAAMMTLAAVFSVGGNLMANMLSAPRMTYAMAEEKNLPGWFAALHREHDTPANSIVFYALLCFALAISGSFVWLALVSSLSRLIVYIGCLLALPLVRRKATPQVRAQALRTPGGYLLPACALLLCAWAASYSTSEAWLMLAGLMAMGMLLFLLGASRRKAALNAGTLNESA